MVNIENAEKEFEDLIDANETVKNIATEMTSEQKEAETEARDAGINVEKMVEIGYEAYCGESLPQEEPPCDNSGLIVGTPQQKEEERRKAIQANIDDIIHGQKPRRLYDPETDNYIVYQDGIPGAEDCCGVANMKQVEELSLIEFIRDYRQHHSGKFFTYDELLNRGNLSRIQKGYNEILKMFVVAYNEYNGTKEKPGKVSWQFVFKLIMETGDVGNMKMEFIDLTVLGYYHHTGAEAGYWKLESPDKKKWSEPILKIGRLLGVDEKNYEDLVHKQLQAESQTYEVKRDINLIPAKNGVVDISNVKTTFISKTEWKAEGFDFTPYLLPDGSENPEYVAKYKNKYFTNKLGTNWNPDAKNINLNDREPGYIWSVDQHLRDVTEDGEHKEAAILALWQVMNACFRGAVLDHGVILSDKSDDQEGGGGKSSIIYIIEYTIGTDDLYIDRTVDKICSGERFSLPKFDKGVLCILSHETKSTGQRAKIQGTDTWKALYRADGQTIFFELKGVDGKDIKIMVTFLLACNSLPSIDSEDDAIWRNIILVAFPHTFATLTDENGNKVTRKYVNTDYITRDEVREYVLFKALSLGPISDINPEAVEHGTELLNEKRGTADPVRSFLNQFLPTLKGKKHSIKWVFPFYHDIWSPETGHIHPVTEEEFKRRFISYTKTPKGEGWKLIEDDKNQKGTKLQKPTPCERYLGRLYEKHIGNIGQYIDGTNMLGEGSWIHNKEQVEKRIYGSYIERVGEAAGFEQEEMTPEQEAEEFAEYVAALYFMAGRRHEPMAPDQEPNFDEWKSKGNKKPIARFYSRSGFPTVRITTAAEETAATTATI